MNNKFILQSANKNLVNFIFICLKEDVFSTIMFNKL